MKKVKVGNNKKNRLLSMLVWSCLAILGFNCDIQTFAVEKVSDNFPSVGAIGWIPTKSTSNNCASTTGAANKLCGGFYKDVREIITSDQKKKGITVKGNDIEKKITAANKIIHAKSDEDKISNFKISAISFSDFSLKSDSQDDSIKVSADKPAFLIKNGRSELSGNVVVRRGDKLVKADQISFYRDEGTNKILSGVLTGNVILSEPGKVMVSKNCNWDYLSDAIILKDSLYRMVPMNEIDNQMTFGAWGVAEEIVSKHSGILKLKKATYTTCSPSENSWNIWGKTIIIDRKKGVAKVTNSLFYFQNTPILYIPYFSFPIDKRRKSGFLYPTASYINASGLDLAIPYYINLAPNYDLTVTPHFIKNRGFLSEGLFRYLTKFSYGQLIAKHIAQDTEFVNFKNEKLIEYGDSKAKSRLEDQSTNRTFFSFQDTTNFSENWSGNMDLNYVTDDYFFQDFGGMENVESNSLLNRVGINFSNETWDLSTVIQSFQILHPINQSGQKQDQYRRIPQIKLVGDFPDSYFGLNYHLFSEFTYFDYDHKFNIYAYDSNGFPKIMPVGVRSIFSPEISNQLYFQGGGVTPKLVAKTVMYSLNNNIINPNQVENNISYVVPIFSVDSKFFYERATNLFQRNYTQTLEPRIFYLFVPCINQGNIPNFDTNFHEFDFDQLFSDNRFSGQDRIGDANQISFAATSRLLDLYTSEEKLKISVGEMFAFRTHSIFLDNSEVDSLVKYHLSPVASEVQYNVNRFWSIYAKGALDLNEKHVDNGGIGIRYKADTSVLNFEYNFLRHGDFVSQNKSDSLNRFGVSAYLPINYRWGLFGNFNYNISHSHVQEFMYGVEYQSCCWAARVVQDKVFIGADDKQRNNFQSGVHFQFLLKGLCSLGTNTVDLLSRQIVNYIPRN